MSETSRLNQPLSLRRLRADRHIRDLTRTVHVDYRQLIQPLFLVDGIKEKEAVKGMSGVFRETSDTILRQIESDLSNGVSKFLLFTVPSQKALTDFHYDFAATHIQEIKKRFGSDIWLALDVCLCSSTEHGHCGILNDAHDHVVNDVTTEALAKQALAFAQAGADCIAPSDMMDGRIKAIRTALDDHDLQRTLIMSYSAKFHSKFYGPFRAAADSSPKGNVILKDRATYQIDPGDYQGALRASLRDAEEGADILMVKPGLPYLDILAKLSDAIPLPWSVYQVSGEYAAIEALAAAGLVDPVAAHLELWTAFKRAGASSIITYGARYAKEWLNA